jgi:hypothetical protein
VRSIIIAVLAAAITGVGGFGLIALHGRYIIMSTLRAVEAGADTATGDHRDRYLILLEARTYPKTYLLFGARRRINAALETLTRAPGFIARELPTGPSIWHRNIYFTG